MLHTRNLVLAGMLVAGTATAHEGHGMPGQSHWHATDALGFAAVIGAVLVLAWWSRRK